MAILGGRSPFLAEGQLMAGKLFLLALVLIAPVAALGVTIPTVLVGNPGNAGDPSMGYLFGGVAYEYRIGTYEVTNDQYAEFLNSKAASDPLSLFHPGMESSALGGIFRSG